MILPLGLGIGLCGLVLVLVLNCVAFLNSDVVRLKRREVERRGGDELIPAARMESSCSFRSSSSAGEGLDMAMETEADGGLRMEG